MEVFLRTDEVGSSVGSNLTITADIGAVVPNSITKSQLLAGVTVSVSDSASQLTVYSSGACSNSKIVQILTCSTPTATASPIAKQLPFAITSSWKIAKSNQGQLSFVALPGDYFGGPFNKVIYSSDGINWTQSGTFSNSYQIRDFTYFNGIFRIITNSNPSQYFISSDGVGWTLYSYGIASRNGNYQSIAHLPDGTELLNNYGSGDYLPQRISYMCGHCTAYSHTTLPGTSPGALTLIRNFAVGGGRFIGCDETSAYYSSNGSSWTRVLFPVAFDSTPKTLFANNRVVAFDSSSNKIAYSLDFGTTWKAGNNNLNSGLAVNGGGWRGGDSLVSVNDSFFTLRARDDEPTKVYKSTDGINWVGYDTPFVNGSRIHPQALEYNPNINKYILLGYTYGAGGLSDRLSYATYFEEL